MSEFSNLLSESLESMGLTQAAAEKRTGIDRTVLSKLMSGAIPPSTANLKALVSKLDRTSPVGLELLCAYLRDSVGELGIRADDLIIRLRGPGRTDSWWNELPEARADRLRHLEQAACADDLFNQVLGDLEPLAIKLQAALKDSNDLAELRRANIYPFRSGDDLAVAESEKLPRGDSQQPTA